MQSNKKNTMNILIKKNAKVLYYLIVLISLPLVYLLVYETGGVKYVFSHTMYIVILFSGIMLGARFGIFIGLLAGFLLGPLMPIDTINNEPQLFFNWFYRLLMFVIVGFISGYGADAFRNKSKMIIKILSHNQDTDIPNLNYLSLIKHNTIDYKKYIVVTILVNNHENLINILGSDLYNKILKTIYKNLKTDLIDNPIIMQSDNNILRIFKPYSDYYIDIKEILKILNKPLIIDDIPLYVEFSLGVVIFDNQYKNINIQVFKNADISAKFAQKNNLQYVIYDDKHKLKHYDISLLGVFLKALNENQTFLVYQPKINLKTNQTVGFEALMRWDHPTRGLINPDVFIPLVEETQLIHQLTDWVLKEVVKKIKEFKEHGIDIHISMNVSAKNLLDPQFFNRVNNYVKKENVSPTQIELEIVETVLMSNPEDCKKTLKSFGDQGFTISLDDFGKGYSSLAYLSEFPIKIVKLDKYFMRHITNDTKVQHTVKSTIDLAHKLGYKVVSEGIEEEIVADIARDYQSDYAQGFYFARPIKAEEIIEWYIKQLK